MASTTPPPPLALSPILSPDDLDAFSELSLVLAKVRAGLQSAGSLGPDDPSAVGGGSSSSSTGVSGGVMPGVGGGVGTAGGNSTTTNTTTTTTTGAASAQQALTLSFKDVPGATDRLKHKLQHARAQVRALPDMDRTLEQQRGEMSELEGRIAMQRALLERLRDDGLRFSKDAAGAADKMDV